MIAATSLVAAVAQDLRVRIFAGELWSTALTESGVASSYEIARPTAKAAIERLVVEGLLVRGIHKTARVPELGPDSVRDIYLARAYIESEAVRRLARIGKVPEGAVQANHEIVALPDDSAADVVEPDMRFHMNLIDALCNIRTSQLYRSLMGEVRLCMSRVQSMHLLETKLIASEHQKILDLIEAGEGESAARVLDEHLARARERLASAIDPELGS